MFGAEDYQALFNELGGTDPATDTNNVPTADPETTDPVNTTPTDPVSQPADPNNTDPANGDDTSDEGNTASTDPENNEDTQRQARAFAEMRSTIGKYQKFFKQLQPIMGVNSEDEVIERLLNAGLNAQARDQNVDPALLKRMQNLEEQNANMLAEQKQKAVVESFGLLQKDFNLTNKEVMDFAKELDARNVDVFRVGVDLSTLYRGMHYEDISKKQIEAEKQKWIAEGAAANSAPGVNPTTGKKNNQGKTEINTMGELESLFNSLNKK